MNHFDKGSRVTHVTDPHGRSAGTVVGSTGPMWLDSTLLKVRWDSGVTETVHYTELRRKNV